MGKKIQLTETELINLIEKMVKEYDKPAMASFQKQYGKKKGKSVYYATANKQKRNPETFKLKEGLGGDAMKYLAFTLDYDGEIEDVDDYEVDGREIIVYPDDENLQNFLEELKQEDEFMVSEVRTEVQVWWETDGTMKVRFKYFNEPDDAEFDDYEFTINAIEFNP
jgi:acylphosphatase